MANQRRPEVRAAELRGLKYFKLLGPLLERLHDEATQSDKAGNRKLFFDQYASLLLLYFFNPIVTSLRGIQQASQLDKVQKLLGCERAALGSLPAGALTMASSVPVSKLAPIVWSTSGSTKNEVNVTIPPSSSTEHSVEHVTSTRTKSAVACGMSSFASRVAAASSAKSAGTWSASVAARSRFPARLLARIDWMSAADEGAMP